MARPEKARSCYWQDRANLMESRCTVRGARFVRGASWTAAGALVRARASPIPHIGVQADWRGDGGLEQMNSAAEDENTNHDQGTGFGDEVIHQRRETRIKDEQTETDQQPTGQLVHPESHDFSFRRRPRKCHQASQRAIRPCSRRVLRQSMSWSTSTASSTDICRLCHCFSTVLASSSTRPRPQPNTRIRHRGGGSCSGPPARRQHAPDKLGRQGRRRKNEQQDGDFGGRYAAGRTSLGGRPRQPVITPESPYAADLPGGADCAVPRLPASLGAGSRRSRTPARPHTAQRP